MDLRVEDDHDMENGEEEGQMHERKRKGSENGNSER